MHRFAPTRVPVGALHGDSPLFGVMTMSHSAGSVVRCPMIGGGRESLLDLACCVIGAAAHCNGSTTTRPSGVCTLSDPALVDSRVQSGAKVCVVPLSMVAGDSVVLIALPCASKL